MNKREIVNPSVNYYFDKYQLACQAETDAALAVEASNDALQEYVFNSLNRALGKPQDTGRFVSLVEDPDGIFATITMSRSMYDPSGERFQYKIPVEVLTAPDPWHAAATYRMVADTKRKLLQQQIEKLTAQLEELDDV